MRTFTQIVLFAIAAQVVVNAEENWPRFRGPNGSGHSTQKGIPSEFKADDLEWSIDLPGKGHSSPVIWGDNLFVTSGTETGERILQCLDANTGTERWKVSQQFGANHLHKKNSYASGTPAVDGEHVVVAFADEEHYRVTAYTFKGEQLWTQDLGSFNSQHGQGVSPIIYEGMVIVPNDQWGPSALVAFDVTSGKEMWKSDRRFIKTSYATAMIMNVKGKDQIIALSGGVGLAGIDPETGKQIWASGELPQRTVASPMATEDGRVIGVCGQGGRGVIMVAVDPTGEGDVSQTHIKGTRETNIPYVPTPVIDGHYMYLWNDDGIVCCVDLAGDLGENVWRQRVGGNFSGSPVLIDGRLFCISEDGDVVVVQASPEYKLLGKSSLGESSYSTPAVANGRVYFRTFHKLMCLKAKG
ncbi:MAG: PQQ-binding-like beta-propeller repeat protein [Planctomycetaceae bacterium]|nr:PQQ-binding-like beta-propeller repeat protein [Planctomycetaceae bacterium]